uniref:Uncharacterized protein n=1 Tax=Hyaloperonospora arabidopsidis (strain Emoy2) TaxID=559515 RepID=M4BJI4_HYAAE
MSGTTTAHNSLACGGSIFYCVFRCFFDTVPPLLIFSLGGHMSYKSETLSPAILVVCWGCCSLLGKRCNF